MIYSGTNKLVDISEYQSDTLIYNHEYSCKYNIEKCSSFISKNSTLLIERNKLEYKKDIILNKVIYTRVYGMVLNKRGERAKNVILTLYNCGIMNYKTEYIPISDCVSDEDGEFQFIVPCGSISNNIKVKVSDRNNGC